MSLEMDPVEERDGPVCVSSRQPVVILERMRSPIGELCNVYETSSMSENSITDMKEICKKKNPIRKSTNRTRNKMVTTDSDGDSTSVPEMEDTEKCFTSMSAPEIGACAFEALNRVEEVNRRSKNIKGDLRGKLRDSIKDLRGMITALMLKINAKGDIELIRAENAKETAKNLELGTENEKLKKEIAVLTARFMNKEEAAVDYTCRNCGMKTTDGRFPEGSLENSSARNSRKRRRTCIPSPPACNNAGKRPGDLDASTREQSVRGDENEDRMKEYKEEARISHLKTRRVVREDRQTLAESDELEEEKEIINKRESGVIKEKTLEDAYEIIGKYLRNIQPEPRDRLRIACIEEVNPPLAFGRRVRDDGERAFRVLGGHRGRNILEK